LALLVAMPRGWRAATPTAAIHLFDSDAGTDAFARAAMAIQHRLLGVRPQPNQVCSAAIRTTT
jgi:hypothetical protein